MDTQPPPPAGSARSLERPSDLRARALSLDIGQVLVLSVPLATGAPRVLTPAELDVARRAAAGASNQAIARARRCSPRTVANQLASIFHKLGVCSRAELASRFADTGLEKEAG